MKLPPSLLYSKPTECSFVVKKAGKPAIVWGQGFGGRHLNCKNYKQKVHSDQLGSRECFQDYVVFVLTYGEARNPVFRQSKRVKLNFVWCRHIFDRFSWGTCVRWYAKIRTGYLQGAYHQDRHLPGDASELTEVDSWNRGGSPHILELFLAITTSSLGTV